MKSILVVSFLSATQAFRPVSLPHRASLTVLHETKEESSVDWKRAKHCAEHFGSCEVAEVEDLYKRMYHDNENHCFICFLSCTTHPDSLSWSILLLLFVTEAHKERIQHQLFGGIDLQHESSTEMEHRIIEDELELQLNLLEEQHEAAAKEVQLFPEEMITNLPHLHEHADAEHKEPIASRLVHQAEYQLIQQETSMGEDTLETLAMCAVVMGIVLIPQFLN